MNPSSLLPPSLTPPSFLGGRLLAEGERDSFKFCLGKQQINLLQHMLGSLISSREIRLRGRGTRRETHHHHHHHERPRRRRPFFVLGWLVVEEGEKKKSSFVSQTRLLFPPLLLLSSSSCEKKLSVNEGSAANCFGPPQIMTSALNS